MKTCTLSYDIAVSELSGWKSAVLLAHCALVRSVPGGCGWCAPACGDDFWHNHLSMKPEPGWRYDPPLIAQQLGDLLRAERNDLSLLPIRICDGGQ